METVEDILKFRIAANFYDYKNISIIEELNQARRCIINNFHELTPVSRIRVSLSILLDVILKNDNNVIGTIVEKIHDLRSNILYML